MEYIQRDGEVEITGLTDFDPVRIFECGQCFRWDADENGFFSGVALGKFLRARRECDSVFLSCTAEELERLWYGYFDLGRDYPEIRKRLSVDGFMRKACRFGAGIRILRQDKWEALCSFIISQCNNIPRIKKIIAALSREFGNEFESAGVLYYDFPSAERLAALTSRDLEPLRCGYRAEYIIDAARAVAGGVLDLEALARKEPDEALAALKKLHGVGDKVANCVVLFGLHMLDAFPLDVWMKRAVRENYGEGFDPAVFSPYAGIAQQYIFYYTRSGGTRGTGNDKRQTI